MHCRHKNRDARAERRRSGRGGCKQGNCQKDLTGECFVKTNVDKMLFGPTGSRTPTCSMPWNRSTAILWARADDSKAKQTILKVLRVSFHAIIRLLPCSSSIIYFAYV